MDAEQREREAREVWVVFRDVDYEGSDIVAIHETEDAANKLLGELRESFRGDGYHVEQRVIGEELCAWVVYLRADGTISLTEGWAPHSRESRAERLKGGVSDGSVVRGIARDRDIAEQLARQLLAALDTLEPPETTAHE